MRRALHYVLKIGDRNKSIHFYRNILGMQVLRHEEFEEGCKATCNGPYDGKWSKTMIGYGPEDDNFVLELTYNYGVSQYKLGNDLLCITLKSNQALSNAEKHNWPITSENGLSYLMAPGGYKFCIVKGSDDFSSVEKVSLGCSDLSRSLSFWTSLAGMTLCDKVDKTGSLMYEDKQAKLEFKDLGEAVDHAKAFGRIAFSCPQEQLEEIESKMRENGQKILTPLVSLDTPGKATVKVVILADPDGHEICFVGDEGFRELSKVDPKADELLNEAMEKDKSDEWFAKKGKSKAEA